MLDQKSGRALAGPAAPAMTALTHFPLCQGLSMDGLRAQLVTYLAPLITC